MRESSWAHVNKTKYIPFTAIKSPERLAKIAMDDYISSHPGGVLGKVFN